MNIPESMKAELASWNNGAGIDIAAWIGCSGNFSLAVGYASVFWPEFVLYEGYIFRAGSSEANLRSCVERDDVSRKSVEWIINHLHIADIQYCGCKDLTKDFVLLGNMLTQIYQAKLQWQFPDRPCTVEFYIPEDEDSLM